VKLTVRRLNQRTSTLPHETGGCHIVLLKSDSSWVVRERQLFFNNSEMHQTYVSGQYTHYIVLPNWLH
jgi:hypothetical protein